MPGAAMARSAMVRLRCITLDVTGTLMAYKGELGDYYCMSAKAVGLSCPDYGRVHEGFKSAYKDTTRRFPCFGFGSGVSNLDWWRMCVRDSFSKAGYSYDEETFEKVFKRIYAIFGSTAPYSIFPDAHPFLRWAKSKGIVIGLVSNAEERYRDAILPALGLNQGSDWDVGIFSGLEGIEKPDPRIYQLALERCGRVAPATALHIGDSWRKDYEPAKSLGMHAIVLDRFGTPDAKQWKEKGALVLPDLAAARAWIEEHCVVEEPERQAGTGTAIAT